MKLLLTTITLLMTLLNVKGQQQTNPIYFAQPDLKKFTGQWVYTSDDITFLINLNLVKTYIDGSNFYIDVIQGDYTLKKNGQTIQSSVGKTEGIGSGSFIDNKLSKNKIHCLFHDFERSKSGDVVFELIDGRTDRANWKLSNTEGVRVGKYDYSFSVPKKAVMKKID